MQLPEIRPDRFKRLFLNNKFVLFLLTLLLIGLNIFVLNKIPFVFKPFIVLVKTVLLPLILTGVVYYLLNPIVDLLERRNMKRIYSIISLYILILAVITLLILAVIPVIHTQIMELVHNFPAYSEQVQLNFESWIGNDIFNQIQQTTGFNPSDWTQTITQRLSSFVSLAGASIGSFIGFITETLLAIAVVPFILFYLLKEGKRLPDYILSFLPNSFRNQTFEVMSEMNHQISTYIRGQIIVSFCIGFLLYIGYLIIGLKYSLILAIIAAFTSVVPYLGPAIAITPALIVAAVTSPVMLLKMIVIWTIVQLIEGKFISPQIMGKTLKIHPITIIFVILTAGNLFGLVGIILAVPGYAVLKVIASHLFDWFKRRSGLYRTFE
ncbi:AI-2E family transporter [Paenibacillus sp. FSL H7-0331]|jgi:predicted PurR-regulated permease PerM|uniref:AI-2E family transporter n=1 Tax=Paenibacillus sp. FSL H7-0331 TaxID=1920421 RepID=UPI00096FF8FC|nr:AI-2E family transporter [Paenibacillus sp. FSL H7-0331]OMF16396.1 AI-2E family transporter [Paenibacillus sp. FSL H7-0331]